MSTTLSRFDAALALIGADANGTAKPPRHRDGQPESIVQAFGLTVHIDRHAGTVFEGKGPSGRPYRVVQRDDYGYLPGVQGDDGQDWDVYLGPHQDSGRVYVVTQNKIDDGSYDEQKGMLGYASREAAEECYRAHTHPRMFGGIGEMALSDLHAQLKAHAGGVFRAKTDEDVAAEEPPPSSEIPDMKVKSDEPTNPSGAPRDTAPEPPGNGGHAPPDGVLLRTALVRTVRREDRLNPATGTARPVVVVDFVASTEDVDSHGSVLVCDWDQDGRLKRYTDNPVLLWMHGREDIARPAIGKCENVRVENRKLLATAVFDDTTDFDRGVAEKYAKGVLNAFSVGFCPGEVEIRMVGGEEVIFFSKNELRENSAVNVGSNASALAQRAFIGAARDLAKSRGGRVEMRDVIAQIRASNTPAAPVAAPPIPTPTPPKERGHGDTMTTKKTIEIEERDVRADKGGVTCSVGCPHCEKDFDMSIKAVPMPPEKALELQQTRDALTRETASLTEARALLSTEQKRATELETKLADATARATALLLDGATREIDQRVGKKIEPHERDAELDLARLFLSDATPDPDSKDAAGNPTRTLGQKKLTERLARLDQRRDLGLLGAPITGTPGLPAADPKVSAAVAPNTSPRPAASRAGDGFADLLDSPAAAA